MLIQGLCEYYDVLAKQGKLQPEGYSSVEISYLISLTSEGKMDGIMDLRTAQSGAKKSKQKGVLAAVPKRTEKPGIEGNVVEHRPQYIFGLNYDVDLQTLSAEDRTDKARKSHDAFVQRNGEFFADLQSPICIAYKAFIEKWKPENETENPHLLNLGKELSAGKFAFCLSGRPDILLHECTEVKEKWEGVFAASNASSDSPIAQCGILGQKLPIARIHDKIRQVPAGSTMGNTLINFNNEAECSYGYEQSFNSNVSEQAMVKYTQALNYLMANSNHRTLIDGVAIFHWAASNDESCDELFNLLTFSDELDAEHTEEAISGILKNAKQGVLLSDLDELMQSIDPNVTFYIVGFKPNSSRLAVKFVYRQQFGKIIQNLIQHQLDMKIQKSGRPLPVWRIKKELISPKSSRETVDPCAITKLMDAIIYGHKYPDYMLSTMARRIRTDRDDENNSYIKMNPVRMGIIKGYINRDNRIKGQEEEIKMALDESNMNPAYICGRLFAVLEGIQRKALGYNLNRTIKDTYFASASARPAVVFPNLLTLAQHHLRKLDYPGYEDENIKQLIALLGTEFPNVLSLKEQGIFMLGYYQQKNYTDEKIKEYMKNKEEA